MVNIFTRKITGDLTSLVKKIDEIVQKNKKRKMAAYVVLLSDSPDADEKKLKELAKKEKISKNVPLTVFEGVSGPESYKVAKDAEVTVMMWVGRQRNVKVNHAFRAGELKKASINKIVADTAKILKDKKG